jgi:hypothetical protein
MCRVSIYFVLHVDSEVALTRGQILSPNLSLNDEDG